MRIESEVKLGFKDVLLRPKRSTIKSRSEVSLIREYKFKHSGLLWSGVPIIASNMDTIGTFPMAKSLSEFGLITAIHKHYEKNHWLDFLSVQEPSLNNMIMISCGILDRDFEKLQLILEECRQLQFICIDVANGYTEYFVDFVKKIRDLYPSKTLVAGNVVTPEMTEELIISGADIVKVGIGPGSVCTTRVKTGVGYPQLSAIIECADAAHGLKGHVISDGGCVCGGDVVKAFASGADFVMLGGMLSGHDEGGGEEIIESGKKYRKFYGMSSDTAMKKHSGGVAEYRASEGKSVMVPYKGSVTSTVKDILGGVRSACTYVGASELKELSKRTTFIRTFEQENKVFSN